MDQSLLWRHIDLLMGGVYSSNHGVLISMTRRKIFLSVLPPACTSVCNAAKNAYSFIVNSRKIVCISDERAWRPSRSIEKSR